MATIREDVVSISFDVENNPFADLTAGIDEMKAAVGVGVDKGTNSLKEMAKGASSAADGVKETTQEAKKAQKGFTDMVKSAKSMAKVKVNAQLDKLKSIPTKAKSGFDKLKGTLTKLKSVKLSDIGKGLDKALGKGITSSGKLFTNLKKAAGVSLQKLSGGLKNMATHAASVAGTLGKGLAKGVVAGVGAASAAVGGLVTASVKAYADYEQLVGGVDTLFKGSSKQIQQYANNAYKTSGLSANKYMETATSFSASLISSVGGDTKKAASMADMAIRDMSDNANKMGTDMESIIETYQSLAKGNYAMLDNLKLGYGGTKSEMQRLIKDAAKIDKSVDANNMSYGNMVKALHVIQNEMGITGTTQKEAEKTISGSLSSLKASWANMMTALVQGGDSFDQCLDNLVNAATTFGKNVIPVIKQALTGVTKIIAELAPILAAEIPKLVTDILPLLVNAGISMVQSLLGAIQGNLGQISSVAVQIITSLVTFLLQSLPQLILMGMQLLISLVQGISQQLPTLIPMAIQAIITLVNGLIGMLPTIISAGIDLIINLVLGLTQALPQLIPAGIQAIITLINGIVQALPQLLQAALQLIPVVIDALIQNLPLLIQGGIQVIVALIQGLGQAIPQLISFLPQICDTILNSIKDIDLKTVGKDLIKGLINGIKSMAGAVKNAAGNIAKSAGNAIKSFLKINSPSKLTFGFGKFTGEGLALGMQKMKDKVTTVAQGLSTNVSTAIQPSVNAYTPNDSAVSNTSNRTTTNNFNPQFTLNMNGASATEANKHKVKQWVKESIKETFESMGRVNPELCEV